MLFVHFIECCSNETLDKPLGWGFKVAWKQAMEQPHGKFSEFFIFEERAFPVVWVGETSNSAR